MDIASFLYSLQLKQIKIWLSPESKLLVEAPQGSVDEDLLALMKENKEELVCVLSENNVYELQSLPYIYRLPQHTAPLSFSQQRLWVFEQYQKKSHSLYNESIFIQFNGLLDIDALQVSFNEIVRQHAIFRTVIGVDQDGLPIQNVFPYSEKYNTFISLKKIKNSAIEQQLNMTANYCFDVLAEPLIKISLFEVEEDNVHILSIVQHHLITDGYSIGIFLNELATRYNSLLVGKSPTPSTSFIQYADFSIWQQYYLKGDVLNEQLVYWKHKLSGFEQLTLSTDKPRPVEQSYNGAVIYFELDTELTRALKQLAKSTEASLFMVLISGFYILLRHYSNQEDLLIGTSVANRNQPQTEGVMGCFINLLALRVNVGQQTIVELIECVKQTCLDAYQHQDLPFEILVKELNVERDRSRSPIFQVFFELQNAMSGEDFQFSNLQHNYIQLDSYPAKFDLNLDLREQKEKFSGRFIYNTDLYNKQSVQRMLEHYKNILIEMTTAPENSVMQVNLLTKKEEQYLLHEVGQSKTVLSQGVSTVIDEFNQQVLDTPDNIAVVYEAEKLTYRVLHQRSNQLASEILERVSDRQRIIAFYLERDIDYLICMLAVWKCACIFVPLNPAHPLEKNKEILEQFQPELLFTKSKYLEQISELVPQTNVLLINRDEISKKPSVNFQSRVLASDIAYIIFTSGSTGKPKGAMIQHDGMMNHICAKIEDFNFTEDSKLAQTATQTFDVSIWQYMTALLTGGTTIVFADNDAWNPAKLLPLMRQHQITVYESVPSHFAILLEYIKQNHATCLLPHLRWMIMNGEGLTPEYCRRWFEFFPDIPMANVYGPTECSDDITHYRFHSLNEEHKTVFVSIGKPIRNVKLYVLDSKLKLKPMGIPGELYVSGVCVGRGYLGLDEKTNNSFIKNPYQTQQDKLNNQHAMLYRTGDVVRWLPDGNLDYLERVDFQVKVRGQRIELGEINNKLIQHPLITSVATIVDENTTGQPEMIAYCVTDKSMNDPRLVNTKISDWQRIWDAFYSENKGNNSYDFNVAGWLDSYTGQPFSDNEIMESITNSVNRILASKPKKILEIGCGTGLLLFRLAHHCTEYHAMDTSQAAVDYVSQYVDSQHLDHVKLYCRAADSLNHFSVNDFDMIIINNAVQYFPNLEYLQQVIHQAFNLLSVEGRIFIGDVYNHRLLAYHHSSVEYFKSNGQMTMNELNQRINYKIANEEQLFVDPNFFYTFSTKLPLSSIVIELKQGTINNEMLKYRYDVLLSKQNLTCKTIQSIPTIDARRQKVNLLDIVHQFKEKSCGILKVENILNQRLVADKKLYQQIKNSDDVQSISEREAIDPMTLWQLGEELACRVHLTWANSGNHTEFDVIFAEDERHLCIYHAMQLVRFQFETFNSDLSNNPLLVKQQRALNKELKEYLSKQLPSYMVPSLFVLTDNLPINQNGKLDRGSLPKPAFYQKINEEEYIAPNTKTEKILTNLWCDVLKLDKVGINDNFFAIGGHSLSATQVVSRIFKTFSVDCPIKAIFDHQTINDLAEFIDAHLMHDEVF